LKAEAFFDWPASFKGAGRLPLGHRKTLTFHKPYRCQLYPLKQARSIVFLDRTILDAKFPQKRQFGFDTGLFLSKLCLSDGTNSAGAG